VNGPVDIKVKNSHRMQAFLMSFCDISKENFLVGLVVKEEGDLFLY
jgi:hypothetical protein